RPSARGRGLARGGRRGRARAAARTLALEPRVDVALAKPPLPSHAHGGDLAGLDQPVDGPQIDLEVLEHLLGRQEAFVDHETSESVLTLPPSREVRSGTRRRHPPRWAPRWCPRARIRFRK